MAQQLYLVPSSISRTPSPPLSRRPGQALNTIIEEDSEYDSSEQFTRCRGNQGQTHEKIIQWFSPRSDRFPTPRGLHFLSAPDLPSSPSTDSADETNSPTSSSAPWRRASVMTDGTDFEDLYDLSDDDEEEDGGLRRVPSRKRSLRRRSKNQPEAPKPALPKLSIPASQPQNDNPWSGKPDDFKSFMSPIPPTPTTAVVLSPEAISFLEAQHAADIPTISAPPSLDGSMTSEQMAAMSAPPTPDLRAADYGCDPRWSGVALQPGAMATLRALSGGSDVSDIEYQTEQVIEIPEPTVPMSQQSPQVATPRRPSLRLSTSPTDDESLDGLTRLEIPSPAGFFAGLSPRSRNAWHNEDPDEVEVAPPTSTTAEQFYRCPWNEEARLPLPPSGAHPIAPAPPRPHRFTAAQSLLLEQMTDAPSGSTVPNTRSTAAPVIEERVVEVARKEPEDVLTARIVPQTPNTARQIPKSPITAVRMGFPVSWKNNESSVEATTQAVHGSAPETISEHPSEPVVATEIVSEWDPVYAKKQQEEALSSLDRTEHWLMAQKAYLNGVQPGEEEEKEDKKNEEKELLTEMDKEGPKVCFQEPAVKDSTIAETESVSGSVVANKKTVRFLEMNPNSPCSLPPRVGRQESAYYRAFQNHIIKSRSHDAFVHRLPRFEALQAQRVSLRELHRNQLLGKFQLSVQPQSAKKRMSANVVRGDDVIEENPDRIKLEKEAEAASQMAAANWNVSAIKALNGGRLFSAPLAKRLARLSRMHGPQRRARILDLGGQATGDWAWHCAISYPNTKVYTTTTKAIRQLSNSNIRGPPNHRQVAVDRLNKLPFPDNHFDLISARELHSILKSAGENGEDEWDSCLAECMRVLKPGGYLEFSVMDADLMSAGPLGLAKSVEFGFSLKTLGYDPAPTRSFIPRLARAGFQNARRAWVALPMGEKLPDPGTVARDSRGCELHTTLEAMVTGSTAAVASITGLAGSWAWERWLLRAELDRVVSDERLVMGLLDGDAPAIREAAGRCLNDVHAVVEEGRRCGAGWRQLTGFAQKPAVMVRDWDTDCDTEIEEEREEEEEETEGEEEEEEEEEGREGKGEEDGWIEVGMMMGLE